MVPVMSLNYEPQTVSPQTFDLLFEAERMNEHPTIDALEHRMGEAVDRDRLEAAARVLACPVKRIGPNWQHGRVIYAVARNYLKSIDGPNLFNLLDIGTAKGFSALSLRWAADGLRSAAMVRSVDVMPPGARVRRNTIAECERLRTLDEILEPFSDATRIQFLETTGIDFLKAHPERFHVAFVDGSHTDDAVWHEGQMIAKHQEPGDVVIFDDYQVPGVAAAIVRLKKYYDLELVSAKPDRTYAIGRRK
jgi:predicted O-methyltransferase YrrM